MLLIRAKTPIQASLVHVPTQYGKHVGSFVNQTVFRERTCTNKRGRGEEGIISLAFTEYSLVQRLARCSTRVKQLYKVHKNAQGGPLCKRGGCVRTLRTLPAYGLAPVPPQVYGPRIFVTSFCMSSNWCVRLS